MSALGYERFAAQGGDWGAFVTSRLGYAHANRLIGIHLNLMPIPRDPAMLADPTPEEARYLEELQIFLKEETGYQWIQGTRPQTLAFALSDSPVGLAAWIVEKFRAWSDCGGDLESVFRRTSFWPTSASTGSPARSARRSGRITRACTGPGMCRQDETVGVPAGFAAFPREILRPPRSLAERVYTDLRRWTAMPKGGHFAAMEQPDALAGEIRAFFRPLRAAAG